MNDKPSQMDTCSFQDMAQFFIWGIFSKVVYEEQYQYLCDTKKTHDIKAVDWIGRIKVINENFTLLDKEADTLSERKIVCKMILNNITKVWERGWILNDDGQTKTLKAAMKNLKTIKKVHAKDKM